MPQFERKKGPTQGKRKKKKADLKNDFKAPPKLLPPAMVKLPVSKRKGSRRDGQLNKLAFQSHIRRLHDLRLRVEDPESEMPPESFQEQAGVMKSLLDPNTMYRFRIVSFATASTTAGGVLQGGITFNPTGYGEYSTLSALFNQVRLIEARCVIINVNPHSDGYATGPNKFACFF